MSTPNDWAARIERAAEAKKLGLALRAGKPASFRRQVGRNAAEQERRRADR